MADIPNISFGPYIKPLEYNGGIRRGFVVFPHEQGGLTWWGEPYETPEGDPIYPGTLNGPNGSAFIGRKYKEGVDGNAKWAAVRKRQYQSAGNIDWKGSWIASTGNGQERRRILSYWGPSTRYWNHGGFDYDSNEKHSEIYSQGRIIAIAPYPVLGACLHTGTRYNYVLNTEETITWVIAVCKKAGMDVVYVRDNYGSYVSSSLTDETRDTLKRIDNVSLGQTDGWNQIGETPQPSSPEGYPAEAPWFFDVNGIRAKTMKRCKTNNTNFGIDPRDEDVYIEMKLDINFSGGEPKATFTQVDTTATLAAYCKWTYEDIVHKERRSYTQPALGSWDGEAHDFEEDGWEHEARLYGRTKIAVDFNPDLDKWVYGWLVGQQGRAHQQYWTIGTDTGAKTNPNTGETVGPKPKPSPYTPAQWDHYTTNWFGSMDFLYLVISTNGTSGPSVSSGSDVSGQVLIGWSKSGSKTVAAGGEWTEEDPYLHFMDVFDIVLHYLDMRSALAVGYARYTQFEWQDDGTVSVRPEDVEYAVQNVAHPFGTTGNRRTFMRAPETPKSNPQAFGFPLRASDMETWPANFDETVTKTNYQYEFSDWNSDEAQWVPDWRTFYWSWMENATPKPYYFRKTITEYLRDPDHSQLISAVYGSTEKDEHLVHIEYFDLVKKEVVTKTQAWPEGDIISLLGGGDRLAPGGVI